MCEIDPNPVDAITVGIQAAGMDERVHARTIADHQQRIRLHEETASADIVDLLPKLAWHLDQPFADSSAAPTWLVSKAARRHVTVALSGDGGDENFAGYRRTRYDVLEDQIRQVMPRRVSRHVFGPLGRAWPRSPKLPRPLRAGTLLQNVGGDWLDAYIHSMARIPEARARHMLRPEATTDEPLRESFARHARKVENDDPLSRVLGMDFRTWLTDDILVKVDRMSMAHGLEVRVPFLDTDFVSYAARLPNSAKLAGRRGKQLLRESLRGRVPNDVLDRPKQGFHLPVDAWLNGPLKTRIEALVHETTNPLFDLVDIDAARSGLREQVARTADRTTDLWFVLVLDAFLRHGPQAAVAGTA